MVDGPGVGASGGGAAFTRLEDVTGEAPGRGGGWVASEVVGTGEGTVVWVGDPVARRVRRAWEERRRGRGGGGGGSEPVEDPERAAESADRARRRAARAMRLYAVRNRLTRLWTWTYAEAQWDAAVVKRDANAAMGRLRKYLGRDLPYLYVLELHPGGHGLHVHVLLPSTFIAHEALSALWGHGFVQYSDREVALEQVKGQRARARMAARYLVKYVGKDVGRERPPGEHRYEVAQGFAPEVVRRSVESDWAGYVLLCSANGGEVPVESWSSAGREGWRGPPCRWWLWL